MIRLPYGADERHTAEYFKHSRIRVEQHFMASPGVSHQPDGSAVAQLDVCQLDAAPDPANKGLVGAPIKLQGYALPKLKQNERSFGSTQSFLDFPQPDKCGDSATPASGIYSASLEISDGYFTALLFISWTNKMICRHIHYIFKS